MQAKILDEIEELTLHLVEEHERNDRIERRSRDMKQRNRELGRLARLELATTTSDTAVRTNK